MVANREARDKKIVSLFLEGRNKHDIARIIGGITDQTVYLVLKRNGLFSRRRKSDIVEREDYLLVELGNEHFAKIDRADREKVEGKVWRLNDAGYAIAVIGGKRTRMHRLLLNAPPWLEVDHKNLDKLDNRRNNIRLCSRGQNEANKPGIGRSKFRGVSFHKASKKWRAIIKECHIGYFPTEEAAARAYDAKALELHGDFAHLNF